MPFPNRWDCVADVKYGRTVLDVAHEAGVTRQTVYRWIRRANEEDGFQRLRRPPVGRPTLLPATGSSFLLKIEDQTPEELGLRGQLWTPAIFQAFLRKRFRYAASISTVRRFLSRMGLPRQPRWFFMADARRKVFEAEFFAICNEARRKRQRVLFLDEFVIWQDQERAVVLPYDSPFSVYPTLVWILGANREIAFFVTHSHYIAGTFDRILEQLASTYGGNLLVVADRHPTHLHYLKQEKAEFEHADVNVHLISD